MTKNQRLVYSIVGEAQNHPTAFEIYTAAKREQPTISASTVYRSLGILVEKGEVRRVGIPNAPDRFDHTLSEHPHMICDSCGSVSDVQIDRLNDLIRRSADDVVGYDLTIHCICKHCRANQA